MSMTFGCRAAVAWGLVSLAAALVTACGDSRERTDGGATADGGGADGFDEEAARFADVLCEVNETCAGMDRPSCVADILADMADAKAVLDDAGRLRCIQCMETKRTEAPKVVDADCDPEAVDPSPVFAACDLDPAVDFDGDGRADNDHDEACAGFP